MVPRKTVNFISRESQCQLEIHDLAVKAVVGQHSPVTVRRYPLTSKILHCCPLRDFGEKQFHCSMSFDLEVTDERAHWWETIPAI